MFIQNSTFHQMFYGHSLNLSKRIFLQQLITLLYYFVLQIIWLVFTSHFIYIVFSFFVCLLLLNPYLTLLIILQNSLKPLQVYHSSFIHSTNLGKNHFIIYTFIINFFIFFIYIINLIFHFYLFLLILVYQKIQPFSDWIS